MVTLNFKLALNADYYNNHPEIQDKIEIVSFNKIIQKNFELAQILLNRLDFLNNTDIEIIVTISYEEDLAKQSSMWSIKSSVSDDRGITSLSQTLVNPDNLSQYKVFYRPFPIPERDIINYIINVVFYSQPVLYLPAELIENEEINSLYFNDLINYLVRRFLKHCYFCEKIVKIDAKYFDISDLQDFFEIFQKKIKKLHFQYQSNGNLSEFLNLFIEEFVNIILNYIKTHYFNYSTNKLNPKYRKFSNFLTEILQIKTQYDNNEKYSTDQFIETLKSCFELCFIDISARPDGKMNFNVINNPKLLFKGELLDTQMSIVAFVDILGFKDFISEYDNNKNSNKLKELKTAIENSVSLSTKQLKEIYNSEQFKSWGDSNFIQEIDKLLEYRVFSDCFSFSLPYFDTEKDFATQFAAMVIVLRIFQYNMLMNKFLIRGGLSYGSYYSDENMLFSGGLVEAYKLEHNDAKMPRLIIDKILLEKIKVNNELLITILGLTESLVIDTSIDDYSFINPFGLERILNTDLGTVVENIDTLYGQLGINIPENEPILKFLKILKANPLFANLPLDLNSPFQKVQNLQETHYKEIEDFVNSQMRMFKNKAELALKEEEKKEFAKTVGKYEWLFKFYNWEQSNHKSNSDTFHYLFKKP